jgi:hypothetical protein
MKLGEHDHKAVGELPEVITQFEANQRKIEGERKTPVLET